MSKIIGTHIIGNNLYIIKKRGLLDSIFGGWSLGRQSKHSINIEKPEFNPMTRKCHTHKRGRCSPRR